MTGQVFKRVILESPFAGERKANRAYALECARFCALRGEATLASHLFYPQFLNEGSLEERRLGIGLGLAWAPYADYSVFFTDRGWSSGMIAALLNAIRTDSRFFLRSLHKPVEVPPFTGSVFVIDDVRLNKQYFEGLIDIEQGRSRDSNTN